MNRLLLRVGALLAHIILNAAAIAFATKHDISGRWVSFIFFLLLLFILLVLFVYHLISFFHFIKTKT